MRRRTFLRAFLALPVIATMARVVRRLFRIEARVAIVDPTPEDLEQLMDMSKYNTTFTYTDAEGVENVIELRFG